MSSKSREESGCNFNDRTNHVFHTLGESGLLGGENKTCGFALGGFVLKRHSKSNYLHLLSLFRNKMKISLSFHLTFTRPYPLNYDMH
jgi:hypothetical protein